MPDTEVTREGAQPSQAGDNPQGGKGNEEKVTLTRGQFEALNRQLKETQESERFWATRAKSGQPAETVEEPEDQIETSDLVPEVTGDQSVDQSIFSNPDKWADAISKGPAAIEAFVRKAGFITGTEAAEIARKVAERSIAVERGKMTSDNVIARNFPELQDPKSELWKATAAELKELVAMDPRAKNSPATLYAAAKTAKAGLDAKKATEGRNRRVDTEDDDRYDRFEENEDHEDEGDRRRRADAQDGSRRTSRSTEDHDDMVGTQARQVMREMGVKEEDFLEQKKLLTGSRTRGRR